MNGVGTILAIGRQQVEGDGGSIPGGSREQHWHSNLFQEHNKMRQLGTVEEVLMTRVGSR